MKRLVAMTTQNVVPQNSSYTSSVKACLHDEIFCAKYLATSCVQHLARYRTPCIVAQ